MELSSSKIKNSFILELNFRALILKKFLYFLQKSFSCISGKGMFFKKLLIFQEVTFIARKIKKTILKKYLIFRVMELSIFQEKEFF